MTTKYHCDHDGTTMDFADEKVVCMRVGGGEITKDDFDNNKLADVCMPCWPEIEMFIKNQNKAVSVPEPRLTDADTQLAIDFLKTLGYTVYKPKPRAVKAKQKGSK